jgi:8-amino-7-oxononanoate synthase
VLKRELEDLKVKGLYRRVLDREGRQGRIIPVKGKNLINFSSNDYLGLAANPALIKGAQKAAREFGAGAGASRLLAGGCPLHNRLEREIASFIAPDNSRKKAILFNSGYHANIGAITALSSKETDILSDELNHASIIDGCRLSKAVTFIYRHKDTEHLKDLLRGSKAKRKLIITESAFSMDGDTAPLRELFELADKYAALLYVDEAHAVGVFGKGKGLVREMKIPPAPFLIQMGTFSKAFGSYGGFIAADEDVITYLQNTARTFIFSTALPPPVVGASLAGLELIRSGKAPIKKLWENRDLLIKGLSSVIASEARQSRSGKQSRFELGPSQSPIIPILFDSIEEVLKASKSLYESGIYAPAIRPPTVKRPRLRITVCAGHGRGDIKELVKALEDLI